MNLVLPSEMCFWVIIITLNHYLNDLDVSLKFGLKWYRKENLKKKCISKWHLLQKEKNKNKPKLCGHHKVSTRVFVGHRRKLSPCNASSYVGTERMVGDLRRLEMHQHLWLAIGQRIPVEWNLCEYAWVDLQRYTDGSLYYRKITSCQG